MKKQKTEPDWKQFGQFVSKIVALFTLVRDTLASADVEFTEAVAWAVGEGRKAFVANFLKPLATRIAAARPKPVITSIVVDLGAFPKLPFTGASVVEHQGAGTATLERRVDGLYLDGRKIVLHLSERQLNGKTIKGHELRQELSGKPVLNANVLDTLYDHLELIPEDFKKDELGNTSYIFFWGTIYRNSDGSLYVRALYFDGGRWYRYDGWLGSGWSGQNPAALAS